MKSTKVEEVAELAADGVNGETRDRLQKITKYYNVTHEVYDDGQSSALLKTWLANQANEDAGAPQLPFAGGLRFNYLDGTAGGFTMTGCNLGPLSYSTNERTSRTGGTVAYRCQTFATVVTA